MWQRRSLWRLAAATVAMVILTRVPALVVQDAINDESYYSVVANEMLHGGLPYQDAVDRKPPLLYGVYWTVYRVAGFPNWPALHLVAIGWTLTTMAVLFLLGRRLFTPLTGAIAALLYGGFQPFLTLGNLAFNGEMLMNLPVVGALLVALRPGHPPRSRHLFLAGVLVAIAFLLKQPAGIMLLPLVVYAMHPRFRGTEGYRPGSRWIHAGMVGAGFALVMGVTGLLLRQHGILAQAWYWSVVDHDVPHGPLDLVFWRTAGWNGALFAAFSGPLLIGAWLSLRTDPERWRGLEPERDALIAFLLVSLVGTAASGRFFLHYFLQLMPPLALLAAPALVDYWNAPAGKRRRAARALLGWSILSMIATLIIESYDSMLAPPLRRPAVAWLSAHAAPDDRLFVWGEDPHFYLASGCRPASRYFASFPLTGYIFGAPESWDPTFDTSNRIAPGAWDSLAADFARHPPRYIVDTDGARAIPRYPIARFRYLADLLDARYRLEYRGTDGLVYARRE